jgi:hypothetical protein
MNNIARPYTIATDASELGSGIMLRWYKFVMCSASSTVVVIQASSKVYDPFTKFPESPFRPKVPTGELLAIMFAFADGLLVVATTSNVSTSTAST